MARIIVIVNTNPELLLFLTILYIHFFILLFIINCLHNLFILLIVFTIYLLLIDFLFVFILFPKVLVMDKGAVAEYDSPANLLKNKHSMFSALVADWESGHEVA
jgi:hypothetical protein